MAKERRDHYYWKAKKEGFRSRAAYKLLQINEKYNILKPGYRVIDLGAAPGGWTQVSRLLVGEKGLVIAVDKEHMNPLPYTNVKTLQLDITSPNAQDELIKALRGKQADVVLCDASPNLTGIWHIDQYRQLELVKSALNIAEKILKSNGIFVTKAFQGEDFKQLVMDIRRKFKHVFFYKPKASRKGSAEIYIIAIGFKK